MEKNDDVQEAYAFLVAEIKKFEQHIVELERRSQGIASLMKVLPDSSRRFHVSMELESAKREIEEFRSKLSTLRGDLASVNSIMVQQARINRRFFAQEPNV